jgi:hypothetical protein
VAAEVATSGVHPRPRGRAAERDDIRAGVRAWCDRHDPPCLPARAANVVAFLAAERGRGLSVTTIELSRAAIRHLHFISGRSVPTVEAQVGETMAGMHCTAAGQLAVRKLAATADILRQILEPITLDLAGLRALLRRLEDRAGRGARLPARGRPA